MQLELKKTVRRHCSLKNWRVRTYLESRPSIEGVYSKDRFAWTLCTRVRRIQLHYAADHRADSIAHAIMSTGSFCIEDIIHATPARGIGSKIMPKLSVEHRFFQVWIRQHVGYQQLQEVCVFSFHIFLNSSGHLHILTTFSWAWGTHRTSM